MAKAIINTARNQGKISKYIYGQFAEHLGRCIYEGLYVDENTPVVAKNIEFTNDRKTVCVVML